MISTYRCWLQLQCSATAAVERRWQGSHSAAICPAYDGAAGARSPDEQLESRPELSQPAMSALVLPETPRLCQSQLYKALQTFHHPFVHMLLFT